LGPIGGGGAKMKAREETAGVHRVKIKGGEREPHLCWNVSQMEFDQRESVEMSEHQQDNTVLECQVLLNSLV